MKNIDKNNELIQSQWISVSQLSSPPAYFSHYEQDWLTYLPSLTQRLRQLKKHTVKHIIGNSRWQRPQEEELELFIPALRLDDFWIRNIEWQYQQQAWIIARTVIPRTTLAVNDYQLQEQQHRAIGELLFAQQQPRLNLEIRQLTANHCYYRSIQHHLPTSEPVWARRSLFHFHQRPLLVIEFFLPQFFAQVSQSE